MVGSTIRKIRRRKKLTQNDLAKWLGVSRQAIAMWELEKREIRIPTLRKIANVFGVPVEDIIMPKYDHINKKETNMPTRRTKTKTKAKRKVIFELMAPEAKKVLLTGDFNAWNNKGITMRKSKTGLWKKNLELLSGRYEYKFIVDNQWWTDPANDNQSNNEFGAINSVKQI